MKTYKAVNVNYNAKTSWLLTVIVLIVSVIIVITLMCVIRHKSKMNFCQSVGKRLANGHDLGDMNVKRSPSNDVGEQIEMTILIETQNVKNGSKGYNSFKRTDASLAWAPSQ